MSNGEAVDRERLRILREVEVIVTRAIQAFPKELALKVAMLGVEINNAVGGLASAAKNETRAS